jgi:hypothetical protein
VDELSKTFMVVYRVLSIVLVLYTQYSRFRVFESVVTVMNQSAFQSKYIKVMFFLFCPLYLYCTHSRIDSEVFENVVAIAN